MRVARTMMILGRHLLGRLQGRPVLSSIVIQPTLRCNLSCLYCNSSSLAGDELDLESWRDILSEARNLGCRRVAIHGGEPLLRSDIGALIAAVKENGMTSVLTSNGLLVKRFIDVLQGLDTLVLSLDAPNERNDRVRGKGVFEKVCAAIDAARDADIPTKLNAVLSCDTISELDELISFTESHDLYLTVNVVRSGNSSLWREPSRIRPGDGTMREIANRLSLMTRHNSRLLFSRRSYDFTARWPDFSVERIEIRKTEGIWQDVVARAPKCHAGRAYLVIAPNGDVAPCPLTAGRNSGVNAKQVGLMRAWQSLHQHQCVACYSPCLVEQNFLYSLNPEVMVHHLRRHLAHFA